MSYTFVHTSLGDNFTSKETTQMSAVREVVDRVARWFVSKPKIPIWVNFGGP
jgi:hypothetical protein